MITMLVLIVVVLIIAYAIVTLIPKPAMANNIIWLIAILICVVLLLRAFGIA